MNDRVDPFGAVIVERLSAACEDAGADAAPVVDGPWVRVSSVPAPAQGWKLHVSPWRSNGLEVLDRCVPVLLAEGASFKVCSTLAGLAKMTRPWRRSTGHRDRSCSWRSISSSSGRSWSSVAWTATRRRRTARAHATGYVMRRRCSVDWLTRV